MTFFFSQKIGKLSPLIRKVKEHCKKNTINLLSEINV